MDYETFMLRLAQAEKKLLDLGIIKEPVVMREKEKDQKKTVQRPKIDAKKLWEEQQQQIPVSEPQQISNKKWWKISPVLEATKKTKINLRESKDLNASLLLDNDEKASSPEVREYILEEKTKSIQGKMIADAEWMYKDLLAELSSRKKPS